MTITEEDIKRASLGFLKTYYKYHTRIGETKIQTDNVSKRGIIADAMITFQTDLDEHFESVVEATSVNKKYEVIYRIRKSKLFWDSFSVSTLFVTALFFLLYINQLFLIKPQGIFIVILTIISSILTVAAILQWLFRSLSRYRKIYALEQFKLYDADEQWVAIAHDVFPYLENSLGEKEEERYLNELKRQCVLYGFGLLMVDEDLRVRPIITPSKIPMEGKKRQTEQFTSLEELKTEPNKKSWRGRVKNYADALISPVTWEKEKRFRQQLGVHFALICICFTLLGFTLWKEGQKISVKRIDNSDYRQKMLEKKKHLRKESRYYTIEKENVVSPDSIGDDYDLKRVDSYHHKDDVTFNPYLQDSMYQIIEYQDTSYFINNENTNSSAKSKTEKPSIKPIAPTSKSVRKRSNYIPPICMKYKWKGKRYILQDGVYSSLPNAQFRIEQINKATALGGVLQGLCFLKMPNKYIVFVNKIYTSKEKATSDLSFFNKLLKEKGYSAGELRLRELHKK